MDRDEVARRLERIRRSVREQLAMQEPGAFDEDVPQEAPARLAPPVGLAVGGEPNLTETEHLAAANRTVDPSVPAPSRAAGLGPVINGLRRLFQPLVKLFVGGHLGRQHEFNAHAVRHLNELGHRLEARVRGLEEALEAWSENPDGIEARLQRSLDDYDAALRQRHMTLFSALEEEILVAHSAAVQVQRLEERFVGHSQAIDNRFSEKDQALESAMRSLEGWQRGVEKDTGLLEEQIGELLGMRTLLRQAIAAAAGAGGSGASASGAGDARRAQAAGAGTGADTRSGADTRPAAATALVWDDLGAALADEDYRAFQAGFRGDAEEILERLKAQLAHFEGVGGTVADLGCGRGEFLDLLAGAGIEAVGVDTNGADVEECRRRGHEAVVGDLFDWLEQRPPASLDGIFMAQVIEHLAPPRWQTLVELAASRLAPGGRLVIETINPESLYALARAYVIDPTHVRPVHGELIAFLARRAGFHPVDVHLQAPVPAAERPTGLPMFEEGSAAGLSPELLALKEAIVRLDRICCAPQEYTLVAVKPDASVGDDAGVDREPA